MIREIPSIGLCGRNKRASGHLTSWLVSVFLHCRRTTLKPILGIAGACGPLVASGYVSNSFPSSTSAHSRLLPQVQIALDTQSSINSVAASNGWLLIGLGYVFLSFAIVKRLIVAF